MRGSRQKWQWLFKSIVKWHSITSGPCYYKTHQLWGNGVTTRRSASLEAILKAASHWGRGYSRTGKTERDQFSEMCMQSSLLFGTPLIWTNILFINLSCFFLNFWYMSKYLSLDIPFFFVMGHPCFDSFLRYTTKVVELWSQFLEHLFPNKRETRIDREWQKWLIPFPLQWLLNCKIHILSFPITYPQTDISQPTVSVSWQMNKLDGQ